MLGCAGFWDGMDDVCEDRVSESSTCRCDFGEERIDWCGVGRFERAVSYKSE